MSQTNPPAEGGAGAASGEAPPAPVFSAEDYRVNAVPPSGAGVVATNVDVWSSSPEFELPGAGAGAGAAGAGAGGGTAGAAGPGAGAGAGADSGGGADAVGELRAQLEALQRSVDTLTNRPSVESIEPEFVGASKTLRYAQQTADSILEDARTEAAELVADAERQRSDIIRQAREQAERDYGAERDRVRAEAAAWESRRADLVSEIASLSAVIGRYHDGLRALEDRLDLAAESLNNGHPGGTIVESTDSGSQPHAEPQTAPHAESQTTSHAQTASASSVLEGSWASAEAPPAHFSDEDDSEQEPPESGSTTSIF